jgi:hypothetical protein
MMSNVGHAVFWDDPKTFNRSLRAFSKGL